MKTPQKAISQLITQKEILEELKELGVGAGMILEVHASLSAFGYVCGGAQTVVNALIEAVRYSGTLLMAMQCSDNTEHRLGKSADRTTFDQSCARTNAGV